MKKTVIELFAGVGGFRVGLNDIHGFDKDGRAIENNDWDFVWANQWEPSTKVQHAYDCYTTRFGEGSCSNEDISKVDKSAIPNHALVCGGFPCQDYSVARSLSKEKGIEGKKGVLFWDIADVLRIKKAPFVLLENVDRLLKSPARQRGRDFGIMLRTFDDLGYNVEWRVINAAEYGCAQRRRRVFIFAWRKDTKYNKRINQVYAESYLFKDGLFASSFPVEEPEDFVNDFKLIDLTEYQDTVEMTTSFKARFENTGTMIDGLVVTGKTIPIQVQPITLREVREDRNHLEHYFLTDSQNEKFEYLRGPKRIERRKPNGEIYYYSEGGMCYPDNLDLPGRTMLTSEGSINRSTHVIEDKETGKNRLLTPIEAERLQSFPDDWTNTGMPEKRRYFMMGNALVTKIINTLEPRLNEIITNE
ncbi:DNA (cytosine-5-)-methyltransferase [Faecalicoccus acidiformans]|uniref:DNA (cytosine-5-)-methyltransferase n=1 Tax=Faecalicoccus acidiformans TaxID=915173 RepID=UPI0025A46A58|nr:DNA (cytosine-5-)-methyltransferase [Faecalicoccus acidiformans]MDM8202790.1 DNA (cytosine-5-)-methyltransferase [Faecalicoccus acidiformans]